MIGETICWVAGFGLFVWLLKLAEKYLDITILNDLFEKSRLRAVAERKPYPSIKTLLVWAAALSVGIFLRRCGI